MTFYFTYGIGDVNETGQEYSGGWTEVEAPTRYDAVQAYKVYHPANSNGLLPCCSVALDEKCMGKMLEHGNGGKFCHDRIKISREVTE